MDETAEKFAIDFVKHAITEFVKNKKIAEIPERHPPELDEKRGAFVTLHENKELRGCIGSSKTQRKAIENLRDAAIGVCDDPRFPPVSPDELSRLDIEISILTSPKIINAKGAKELLEKIEPEKDGLIIECNGKSGLFLPQVWETLREKEAFLCHLCIKAGLPAGAWRNGARIYKFQARIFKGDFS